MKDNRSLKTYQPDELKVILEPRLGEPPDCSKDDYFIYIKISSARLLELMEILKGELGMNYLANLTAVDYEEEFELVYHLYAIPDNGNKLAVKLRVPRSAAQVPSLCSIYPTANWQEREVYDLMGVSFNQHPNLVRVLLPDDFSGHPLRKDFRREA